MGLIIPKGPSWGRCTSNLSSTINASVFGVACSTGTSNSDGSVVDLFGAALDHDVEYLKLFLSGVMPTSGNNDVLLDIMIDPAGGTSWTEFIPDLIAGALGGTESSGSNPSGPSGGYDFPIWIPAGATLGIRARSAHSVESTITVAAFAFGENSNPASWWCGQRVSSIGINASSSTGTAHMPGDSNAFSSWANLGSTLGSPAGAFQFGVNGPGGTFYSQNAYKFEFGIGDVRIGPPVFRVLTSTEVGWFGSTGPIFKSAAAGSQLRVRGACNGTAQSLGVAAWAVH